MIATGIGPNQHFLGLSQVSHPLAARVPRKEVLEMFMEELDREHKDYDKIVALHLSIDSE